MLPDISLNCFFFIVIYFQERRLDAVKQSLEEKYNVELTTLQKRLDESIETRNRLEEESNAKLTKAQTFFEKELEALKAAQNASNDERCRQLQEQLDLVRKDAAAQDKEARCRNEDLMGQLSLAEELTAKLTADKNRLEGELQGTCSEITGLKQQVIF